MRIIINHLTRMKPGHFCVAGVDIATGRHVRPVLHHSNLVTGLLARYGGPFDIANIVDLGTTSHRPTPPHIEDYLFDPERAECRETADPEAFWKFLVSGSATSLRALFGNGLGRRRGACATEFGEGDASLGCLRPKHTPRLCIDHHEESPKIRMKLSDGELAPNLPVTDIRLFGDDHVTPDMRQVEFVAKRLRNPDSVVLSVGLGRVFAASAGGPPLHYLQVNNIHLRDAPIWQLG